MLHIMDSITDKPGWHTKVFESSIADMWKFEAMATQNRDVTQKMADWVIEELRYEAKLFEESGAISVFNADVVKSDVAVSEATRQALRLTVSRLENVPEAHKDYHPGSDGKVLDLVHPSLFPLVYGRSRILTESLIDHKDCVESIGKGVVISIRPDEERGAIPQRTYNWNDHLRPPPVTPYGKHFQWLPSEVNIGEDGRAT